MVLYVKIMTYHKKKFKIICLIDNKKRENNEKPSQINDVVSQNNETFSQKNLHVNNISK